MVPGRVSRILSGPASGSAAKARTSDDHFSGTPVSRRLKRPTRESVTDRANPCPAQERLVESAGAGPSVRPLAPGLLPYLVLLPMGFTEPDRSPGLLVSSYLTVSPLPRQPSRSMAAGRFVFCGTFPIRLHVGGSRRWALPTIAPCGVRTFLRGMSQGNTTVGPPIARKAFHQTTPAPRRSSGPTLSSPPF